MANKSNQRGKNPNWGGKREGSGRKPQTLSASMLQKHLKKAEKYAKEHGKDLDDVLLEGIYQAHEKSDARTAFAGIKIWNDMTNIPVTEDSDTDKGLGPQIFLPEKRAEVTVFPGGKDDEK